MKEYETRTIKVCVAPKGEATYSEYATTIEIDDDGGGEFLTVTQSTGREGKEGISFDANEWTYIKEAIDEMISSCR